MRTKFFLLFLGLTLLSVSASVAQAHFGLRAAPTIGFFGGDFTESAGHGEWGVELRLNADVRLFGNLEAVAAIAILNQRGARTVMPAGSDSLWGYKLQYMSIPIALRYMFRLSDEEAHWAIAPTAGVYFGLNGTCKIKQEQYHGYKTDCSDRFPGGDGEGTDIGIPVGVEAIYTFVGGSRWEFFARMDVGLKNVLKGAEDLGLTAVHRTLVVGFGFSYPLY
ncbi:MAG: hypothetical protein PVF33_09155 [Candidatus Latescibacterota bacterium]|jgi:hypothetical protein